MTNEGKDTCSVPWKCTSEYELKKREFQAGEIKARLTTKNKKTEFNTNQGHIMTSSVGNHSLSSVISVIIQ